MNTPGFFDEMDHRINRRHLHRVAADQQRFKAEYLTHFVRLEIFAHHPEQRPHRAKFQQIGHNAQHRPKAAEISISQRQKSTLEYGSGLIVKGFISRKILGCQPLDLRPRADGIAIIIKKRAVIEIDAVKWKDWDYFNIFAGIGASGDAFTHAVILIQNMRRKVRLAQVSLILLQAKQFLDEMRHRKHRRPHIKYKAIRLADIGTATGSIQCLQYLRVKAKAL